MDGMRSCPAAMRELVNLERREIGRWLNNRPGKQPSPIPTTGARPAAIQEDEVIAEVRLRPRLLAQPL